MPHALPPTQAFAPAAPLAWGILTHLHSHSAQPFATSHTWLRKDLHPEAQTNPSPGGWGPFPNALALLLIPPALTAWGSPASVLALSVQQRAAGLKVSMNSLISQHWVGTPGYVPAGRPSGTRTAWA